MDNLSTSYATAATTPGPTDKTIRTTENINMESVTTDPISVLTNDKVTKTMSNMDIYDLSPAGSSTAPPSDEVGGCQILEWCRTKSYRIRPAWNIVSLLLCIFNLVIDIYAATKHFINGDYWWGSLTILFTMLPKSIASIRFIADIPNDYGDKSVAVQSLLMLASIVCSPGLPFYYLVRKVRHPDQSDRTSKAAKDASYIKICEALLESYPQAMIQLHVPLHSMAGNNSIEPATWQWLIIVSSLTSLAFTVVTNDLLFENAAIVSKAIFFVFGLLGLGSRLLVCCMYSMTNSVMWLAPFVTELTVSIVALLITQVDFHKSCTLRDIALIPITLLQTTAYNSVTRAGFIVSTINVVWAFGGFSLEVPQTLAITAAVLGVVSCVTNFVFVYFSYFSNVRIDFLSISHARKANMNVKTNDNL